VIKQSAPHRARHLLAGALLAQAAACLAVAPDIAAAASAPTAAGPATLSVGRLTLKRCAPAGEWCTSLERPLDPVPPVHVAGVAREPFQRRDDVPGTAVPVGTAVVEEPDSEDPLDRAGGIDPHDLGAALKADSPVTWVKQGDPPFLILQSNNDTVVYPEQANELSWDLAVNHVPHDLIMVNGGGHVFDDPGGSPSEQQITTLVVQFFVKTLVFRSTYGMGT